MTYPKTEQQVRQMLQQQVEDAGSQKALASRIGCSPTLVWGAMNGRVRIGPKILSYLGLRQTRLKVNGVAGRYYVAEPESR